MSELTGNARVAAELAAQGFAVFPCHAGGDQVKKPMPGVFWRQQSTTDAVKIRGWWKRWPEAAVAIDVGKSGLVVVDADRHGDDDGVSAIAALMEENQFDPNGVPIVATPNSGTHWYFRQPEGEALGNGRGALPAGIDVRGAGGFVLAPGTVLADGRQYEGFGSIAEAPVLPDWLVGLIRTPKPERPSLPSPPMPVPTIARPSDDRIAAYVDAALKSELEAVQSAPRGQRNEQLNRSAFALGQMVGAGWIGEGEVTTMLASAASALAKDDGPASVAKTIRSGLKSGRAQPREAPEEEYAVTAEDMEVSRRLWASFEAKAGRSTRQVTAAEDGTLHDAETGEVIEAEAPPAREPMPAIDYPPGLVGDIARWIAATARRPQPLLSIGAALTIVGTVGGRQFRGPTRSATHLYVLGLAPTGRGKDTPLQQVQRVLTVARLGLHLGPSEFISMPAVINFLQRKPLAVCPMDEFGAFLKRITNKRASGFEASITKILRTLWSASFAPCPTPEWAHRQSEVIQSPALSIFGISTPEQFYGALETAALEDGTLNRFLILNGADDVGDREPEAEPSEVPETIIDEVRRIYLTSGEMAATARNDCTVDPASHKRVIDIGWADAAAEARFHAFVGEIDHMAMSDATVTGSYARAAEMAVRIATIIAIGRGAGEVSAEDMDYGITIARLSARTMIAGVADYMAANENQANAQKIIRIIRTHGGRIKHRDLLKAMQHTMRARDLRDMLALMKDAGQLDSGSETPRGGGKPMTWYWVT